MKTYIMQTNSKKNLGKLLLLFFLIFITILLFINPRMYISSISHGLNVWAIAVLPSLFPFFIITKTFSALNIIPYENKFFKILSKIFKVPACGIYIFFMSIISGYPVGAKLIQEFYSKNIITQKQATKLITLCSTSGPLFIIGTVGVMFFGSIKIGVVFLLSHIFGAVCNGLLFRNKITTNTISNNLYFSNTNDKNNNENLLYEIMLNSILSVLIVGGYIAIFFMIIEMLNSTYLLVPINTLLTKVLSIFNINYKQVSAIINGLIEVTNGLNTLSMCSLNSIKKVVISSLLIGFGGFCVHLQSLTFLISCKINLKFYFFSKITQSLLSGVIALLLVVIFFI